MKRNLPGFLMALSCLFVFSCNDSGGDSAASVAKKWCDLNGKANRAEGDAKAKAEADLDAYEKELDTKYGKDSAMQVQIANEIEKCEDASEAGK